jgi:uncharacterized protein YigE (DUF2233 family)
MKNGVSMYATTLFARVALALSAALVPLPSSPSYKAIQIDPKYHVFQAQAPLGKAVGTPRDGTSVSANFYSHGLPIGAMVSNGKEVKWLQIKNTRATLILKEDRPSIELLSPTETKEKLETKEWHSATVIQAGPLLVKEGRVVAGLQKKVEGFRSDVYRRTKHIAVGITKSGKLIFLYSTGRTLVEVSYLIQRLGAVDAIQCDSGSSAALIYRGKVFGRKHPRTMLTAIPITKTK